MYSMQFAYDFCDATNDSLPAKDRSVDKHCADVLILKICISTTRRSRRQPYHYCFTLVRIREVLSTTIHIAHPPIKTPWG